MRLISRLIFLISGWKLKLPVPDGVQRCVIIASPHTSNWDLLYARAAFYLMDIPLRFTIKDQMMRFPYGPVIRAMGGIGIDRSPRKPGEERLSMTEAMADLFKKHQRLAVMVTPEGSRSLRTEWKTGFYYVAKMADVPIALGYLDYAKKEAGVGMMVHPSDDMESDLRKIMAFYRDIGPKYPKKFSVDLRYA